MQPVSQLVLIEWEDSYGCSSTWTEIVDPVTPVVLMCRSVGWLVYDGDDCKVLVPHIAEGMPARQGCGDMTIPASAIRRVCLLVELDLETAYAAR